MSWGKIKLDPADVLFSKFIRLRDKRCQRCLKPGNGSLGIEGLQASHFQGRRKEATRFHEDNVCALCVNCHRYLGENPAEHYQFQVKRLGQALVDRIVILSNTHYKRDRKLARIYWKARLKQDFPDLNGKNNGR